MPTAKLAPSYWMTPTSYAISGARVAPEINAYPSRSSFLDFLGLCRSLPSAASTSLIAALSFLSRAPSTFFSFLFCSGREAASTRSHAPKIAHDGGPSKATGNLGTARDLGSSSSLLDVYRLPKTRKQAALLFSHDWPRANASMKWFDQVVREMMPRRSIP
jgi:hypothetical protein